MGYRTLSIEQRGELVGKWKEGATYTTLAKDFGIARSTACRIVARYQKTGTVRRKKGTGPKSLLNDRDVRALRRNVSKAPLVSLAAHAQMMTSVMGMAVSPQTISHYLKENGLSSRSAARVPFLSRADADKRLAWAQEHSWSAGQWGRVVYSDESRFSQFSDGRIRVIRPEGTRYNQEHTVPTASQCESVMVWGCFWRGGTGPLVILADNMDQDTYINTLSKHFYNWKKMVQDKHKVNLLLLEDNARPHKGEYATWWKRLHGIETIDWPARSPDMNPIENLWGIIKRRIQQRQLVFSNKDELVEALQEEWAKIDLNLCQNLSDSMVERVEKLVDNKGCSIGK